jgi:flagellar M-ring protein FliF
VAVAVNQREEKDKSGALKPSRSTTRAPAHREAGRRRGRLQQGEGRHHQRRQQPLRRQTEPETPIWKDPENQALFKELIKYLVIAGVIAFVAFGVIRPLLKQVMPQPEPKEGSAAEAAARKAKEAEEGEEGEEEEGAEVELSPEAAAASPTKKSSPRCSNSPSTTRRCSAT